MTDADNLKLRLRSYLIANGYEFQRIDGAERCRCPNPAHTDNRPSAAIYENNSNPPVDILNCQTACQQSWNIFGVASMIAGIPDTPENFPQIVDEINSKLGNSPGPEKKPATKKQDEKAEPTTYATIEEAREVFKTSTFYDRAEKIKLTGKITDIFPYRNKDGEIFLVDVKFRNENGSTTISFWHNGKFVTIKSPPLAIMFLDEYYKNPDRPVLIVEGGAAAKAGNDNLSGFTVLTWRGGTGFADKHDWSFLKGAEVYLLPDDDRKKYDEKHIKAGELLPITDQPGMKSMLKIQEKIPGSQVVIPPEQARTIREDGADMVEILQTMTPEEIEKYITDGPKFGKPEPAKKEEEQIPTGGYESMIPFKILGTDENGISHFIIVGGHLESLRVETLTKNKLLKFADLDFWRNKYYSKRGIDWDQAIDDINQVALRRPFDPDTVCGIGAWKSKSGDVCYNDGQKIHGKPDPDKMYIRKIRHDIGITDEPAHMKLLNDIRENVFKLSFSNDSDAIKALAWSTIAPFGGALDWRPMLMLTGESGSGKTTIANLIIRPIAAPLYLDASITTEPGVRSKLKRDSIPAFFEEAEGKKDRDNRNTRNDLFAIARISANADGPEGLKGTKDSGYVSYKRNNMFGFGAINPIVENAADKNRLVWIEMKKPKNKNAREYQALEAKLIRLLSEINCRAIRAKAWMQINDIMKMIKPVAVVIQEEIEIGYRDCLREGVLLATYFVVWREITDPESEIVRDIIRKYFSLAKPDTERDESEELLVKLFDGKTFQIWSDGAREDLTIREMLAILHTDGERAIARQCKKTLETNGIKYYPGEGEFEPHRVAIANNHPMIQEIIKMGNGYHKYFHRLDECREAKDRDKMVRFGSDSKRSTILTGILDKNIEKIRGVFE